MTTPTDDGGCWDAFGIDDDEEEEESEFEEAVLWLTQYFLRWNAQISLSHRRVYVACPNELWYKAELERRGIHIVRSETDLYDAAIIDCSVEQAQLARRNVVPNGVLMMVGRYSTPPSLDKRVWSQAQQLGDHATIRIKHACPINEDSCPWLPSTHDLDEERRLLAKATVTKSAHETATTNTPLTEHDLKRASNCLTKYGYCVIRNLVDPTKSLAWGSAVLLDLQEACNILKERNGIDLKSPGVNTTNYQELAMREDLRMDLRDGPNLRRLRNEESKHYAEWGIDGQQADASSPIITISNGSYDSCFRLYPDILEIVRRAMNPKDEALYKGNWGRHNFEGSGADGSFQPLRIGPMGGILSLPGSADQALHADTPHLFEHTDCLPAHYIDAFCLGADIGMTKDADGCATGSSPVGGTVFIHDSHRLSFTAEMEEVSDGLVGNAAMQKHLVRPSLQLGDVVLFDCRILHFGLANNSRDIERPLLYTNMTQAWFVHDRKNFDDQQRIFVGNS